MRILFILLALTSSALAEHIYLAQSALGTGDGTSAANAKACYTFWNNDANWDTLVNTTNGKIGPGDTVHIVGVINATGSTPTTANQLFWRGSGTPGNPITLKFDVGGQIRHPTGFSTGLIYSAGGLHDVIIEGGNGAVAMNTGAFVQKDIEIYDNGTNLGNQIEGTSCMILTGTGNNITVKNMYMIGSYRRAQGHPTDQVGDGNVCSLRGLSNLVFDNCRAEFGEGGLGMTSQGNTTGFRITNNYVYGCSTGIKIGTNRGFVNEGAIITGNVIDGHSYWAGIDTTILPNGQYHCDSIQTITPTGGLTPGDGEHRNYTFAYNRMGPDLGIYGSQTALLFLEDNVNGMFIYNNLFLAQSTPVNTYGTPQTNINYGRTPGTGNGFITGGTKSDYFGTAGGIKSVIVNNTILGSGTGQGINSGFATIKGNIIQNVSTMFSVWQNQANNALHGIYFDSDQNIFYHPGGAYSWGIQSGPGVGAYGSFASWKTTGRDLNSITANPQATFPTGVLASTSPAIDFSPTQIALFTDDYNRVIRSIVAGKWDAGAVEFAASADTTPPTPNPMTFASAPSAVDAFSVTMTASTATDAGGAVQYFFDETTGAAGGTDSGWQTSATYLDTGLSPSTLYTYRVKARDPSMNETAYSSGANATTPAGPGGTVNIETLNVGNLRVGQ